MLVVCLFDIPGDAPWPSRKVAWERRNARMAGAPRRMLANVGSLLYRDRLRHFGHPWLAGCVCLAEAAADTVSSECGQVFGAPRGSSQPVGRVRWARMAHFLAGR